MSDRGLFWLVGGGLAILLVVAIWAMVTESNECAARGGRMVSDGTYTYVWQTIDFKTGAGILVPYPNSKCSVVKP